MLGGLIEEKGALVRGCGDNCFWRIAMSLRTLASVFLCVMLAPVLSGCIAVAATGAVAGVSAARQERSFGAAIDDRVIKTTLDARLRKESIKLFGVYTTVIEGRVLLAGRAGEPETRLDATRVAWTVEGVRKVDNDIQVADSGGWLDRPADLIMISRRQLSCGPRSIIPNASSRRCVATSLKSLKPRVPRSSSRATLRRPRLRSARCSPPATVTTASARFMTTPPMPI